MPGNAYLGIEYGPNCAVYSPGHHQVLYQSPGLNEDQNWLENDEVAALKWLQFRSGSGQLRVWYMVVNFDMPGKNSASLEQLAYCML